MVFVRASTIVIDLLMPYICLFWGMRLLVGHSVDDDVDDRIKRFTKQSDNEPLMMYVLFVYYFTEIREIVQQRIARRPNDIQDSV